MYGLKGKEIGEYLSYPWEDLFLLELILEDGHFLALAVLELLSSEGVSCEDGDSFGSLHESQVGDS